MPTTTQVEVHEDGSTCKTIFVWIARILKVAVVCCLVANIAAYVIIIQAGARSDTLHWFDKAFLILGRMGMLLLCIILLIAEFEPLWFLRHITILRYWAVRGFWLCWLGILTIDTALTLAAALTDVSNDRRMLEITGQVIGWAMVGVGLTYALFSILCLRNVLGETKGFAVVTVTTEQQSDLEERLVINNAGPAVAAGTSAGDAQRLKDNALLQANLALALGMKADDAAKRFKGKDGAKVAAKHGEERKKEVEALRKQVAELRQVAGRLQQEAKERGADVVPIPAAVPPAAAYSPTEYVPDPLASAGGSATPMDERRGGGAADDDDDLLKMYYKNAQFDR